MIVVVSNVLDHNTKILNKRRIILEKTEGIQYSWFL